MDDEQTTRQPHFVPEAIKAIRAELMLKEAERPLRRSQGATSRMKKPAPAGRAD